MLSVGLLGVGLTDIDVANWNVVSHAVVGIVVDAIGIDNCLAMNVGLVLVWLMHLWKCLDGRDACMKMSACIRFQFSIDSRSGGASIGVTRRTRRPWRK